MSAWIAAATVGTVWLVAGIGIVSPQSDRVIGLYQPTALLNRLGGEPVEVMSIVRVYPAADSVERPALKLAVVDGQRVA